MSDVLNALSKKIYLELPEPKQGYVTADKERLEEALASRLPNEEILVDYEVFARDYREFRKENWHITVTLIFDGKKYFVSRIEAGDTTGFHYGIAMDLGSTMLAMELLDLNTGKVVCAEGTANPQIKYGEDILSRITYGKDNQDHIRELQQAAVSGFDYLLDKLTKASGIDVRKASLMVVGGNTTMIHFLMGIDAFCIFMTPFTPMFNDVGFIRGSEIGMNFPGMIYCIPSIANYLGGDIISGLLTVDLTESDETGLFMDIGTNGEMVLGNKDFLFAGAGAAGPALEGGISKYGVRAKKGAVSKIRIIDNELTISTIEEGKPIGICGSGIVDLLAEMLLNGWMDKQGRLIAGASERIVETENGRAVIYATAAESDAGVDLYFTEDDILAFRDTKAAANTMVACLLEASEFSPDDVDNIYMVGGFGEHINLESAITIGMYPDTDRRKFVSIGNGSLKGAAMLLQDKSLLDKIKDITSRIYYMEFAQFPDFILKMSAAGFFPHTDLESYPTVYARLKERGLAK